MITVKREKEGIGTGMSGSVGDLIVEFSVALGQFIKHIDNNDNRTKALAEIVINAIEMANTESDTKDGEVAVSMDGEAFERIKDFIDENRRGDT